THMAAEISAAITQRELALDYTSMFATAEPVSWRTRLEEVFTITAISWLPSSFVVGAIFLVADAVTEDGEAILLTTGAMVAMRRLYAAARDGYLPDRVFLAKGPRQTRSGHDVLILHRAPFDD
ncbi:MAG: hypothetical protein ACRDX8_11190, partial [Acidimicrobiales bacterium]